MFLMSLFIVRIKINKVTAFFSVLDDSQAAVDRVDSSTIGNGK